MNTIHAYSNRTFITMFISLLVAVVFGATSVILFQNAQNAKQQAVAAVLACISLFIATIVSLATMYLFAKGLFSVK